MVTAELRSSEPVEPVAWEASEDGRTIQDNDFTHDVVLRVVGDFEDNEQRVRYTQRIVDKLNAAAKAEPVAGRAFLERILAAMEGVIDVADRKTDEFDALRSCVIDLTLMLHTAPPQRKPLPKHDQHCVDVPGYGLMAVRLVRAVERAHGIKE